MSWQIVVDDSFVHADTTAGGAASTTGVPTTPAVGAANGWVDEAGGVASIGSDKLLIASPGGDWTTNQVLRVAAGEKGNPDQRAVYTTDVPDALGGLAHYGGVLRRADSSNFYMWEFTPDGHARWYKVAGGATGPLSASATGAAGGPHPVSIEAKAEGTSPTVLTLTVTDLTTSAQVLTTTASDSTAAMQATGLAQGLTSWSGPSTFTRVQMYKAVTQSFTLSPGTIPPSSQTTVTATGSGTAWTTGTTFSSTIGTITGVSVNAGTQVATFNLIPGATGTALISDTADAATATLNVVAPPVGVVVCAGNSITYGLESTNPALYSYPARLAAHLVDDWTVRNVGNNGQTTESILASAAAYESSHVDGLVNIAIVWEGTNSLQTEDAPTAYATLTSVVASFKTAGFSVICPTVLPAGSISRDSTWQTRRTAYNALVIANTAGADRIVDLAHHRRLTDPTNATYFAADGQLHPTDAGYLEIYLALYGAVMNVVLAAGGTGGLITAGGFTGGFGD